jgi:DNA modification methylase
MDMNNETMTRLFLEEQNQKDLKPSEIAALAQLLLKDEAAAADARRRANLKKGAALPEGEKFPVRGRSLDLIGEQFKMSGRTLGKIVEMAQGGFDKQMDAAGLGRIHGAYRKFLRAQAAEKAAQENGPPLDLKKIICADCRDILPTIPDDTFHAVPTDPPYGIGFDYDGGREPCANPDDYWAWFGPIYKEIVRVTKPGGLICLWQAFTYIDHFGRWFGKWHPFAACKINVQPFADYPYSPAVDILVMQWKPGAKPLIPTLQDRSYNWFSSIIKYGDDVNKLHPCPRPLDLCENLIRNFTIQNGLILDCFAGSGTIPLAVQRVGGGRRCVAIEAFRPYCAIAEKRLNDSAS